MYIEGFGKKRVKLYSIENTDELFVLEFSHNRKKFFGIIDSFGKIQVPISDIPILEAFATNDRTSYCFTKQASDTGIYESYHLLKEDDGKFYLKADIKGNENTNCRLVATIKDEYWFIESVTDNMVSYNLYDAKKAKILTPSFTEISFENEKNRVLAYVEKDVYANIDDENIYLTSLCSYIDYEGNFISSIYDVEGKKRYDAMGFNFDSKFKRFNMFVDNLKKNYFEEYINNQRNVTEVLIDMFNNLYSVDNFKIKKQAKILEYRRK